MSKFEAGHLTKMRFLKFINYLFVNTNFALKLQGKCGKDDVLKFAAHLSVTIERLTRYK